VGRRTSARRRAAEAAGLRSGFELDVREAAEEDGLEGIEYEPDGLVIEWIPKPRKYKPDWRLPNGVIVESKGKLDADARTKHLQIKAQRPDLDIRFVFQFDNKLSKASKTRYSTWCEKHGFKYAFGRIPREWYDEERDVAGAEGPGVGGEGSGADGEL
jgi:hypothetical protein